MYYAIDWDITIGDWRLAMLAQAEVVSSVELLADTCSIELPSGAFNKVFEIEKKLKRGDKVSVQFGYNGKLEQEFTGYLQSITTDDGKVRLNCEDEMFLFRKPVPDKAFKGAGIGEIADYVIGKTDPKLKLDCTLGLKYDKFIITKATAFDVLKKLQEETSAHIYMQGDTLNIHAPYLKKGGDVRYSFQHNIESSSLKYVLKEDRKIEVVVTTTGRDGKKREERYGTSGGEKVEIKGDGLTDGSLKERAKTEHEKLSIDGYEGDITGWLLPVVKPTHTAEIEDEDYAFKDGKYYVNAVTTSISANGGVRKITIGKRVA